MDIIAGAVLVVAITLGMALFCWFAEFIATDDEE